MTQGINQTIIVSLKDVPWWRQAKALEEFLSRDSCEVNRCMCHRTKVLIDHAKDGATAMLCEAHFKHPIKDSGENTLTVQFDPGLHWMMLV